MKSEPSEVKGGRTAAREVQASALARTRKNQKLGSGEWMEPIYRVQLAAASWRARLACDRQGPIVTGADFLDAAVEWSCATDIPADDKEGGREMVRGILRLEEGGGKGGNLARPAGGEEEWGRGEKA
nr:hypothetical protein CFP56_00567 [Quercus suber]